MYTTSGARRLMPESSVQPSNEGGDRLTVIVPADPVTVMPKQKLRVLEFNQYLILLPTEEQGVRRDEAEIWCWPQSSGRHMAISDAASTPL